MRQLTYQEITERIKAEVLPDIEKFQRNLAPLLRECCVCGNVRACPSHYGDKYICHSCSLRAAELDAYESLEPLQLEGEGVCRICGRRGKLYKIDDLLLCSTCACEQVEKRLSVRF